MHVFTAFNYSSFDVDGPDPFLDQSGRNTQALNRTVITLKSDARAAQVRVNDDDPVFGGTAGEQGGAARLAENVSLGGSDYSRGQRIVTEYSYVIRRVGSSSAADNVTIYVFRIDGNIIGVASDRPLVPGQRYRVLQGGENAPAPQYASLAGAPPPICFTPDARLDTPAGPRPVGNLRAGDRVLTRDSGARHILWIGGGPFVGLGNRAPVVVRAGRLGNGRDLVLSPNHRVLVGRGADEGLVAVKALIDGAGVVSAPCPRVTYLHVLLEGHHVISAEGAPVESLWPGPEAIAALRPSDRDPFRADSGACDPGTTPWLPARPLLRPGAWRRTRGLQPAV